jgi:hypothetical protein
MSRGGLTGPTVQARLIDCDLLAIRSMKRLIRARSRKRGCFPHCPALPCNANMAPHRETKGEAHYACAPGRSCAVFVLASIRYWNRDRGCEPTHLVERPNRDSGGYMPPPLEVGSDAMWAQVQKRTCLSSRRPTGLVSSGHRTYVFLLSQVAR